MVLGLVTDGSGPTRPDRSQIFMTILWTYLWIPWAIFDQIWWKHVFLGVESIFHTKNMIRPQRSVICGHSSDFVKSFLFFPVWQAPQFWLPIYPYRWTFMEIFHESWPNYVFLPVEFIISDVEKMIWHRKTCLRPIFDHILVKLIFFSFLEVPNSFFFFSYLHCLKFRIVSEENSEKRMYSKIIH